MEKWFDSLSDGGTQLETMERFPQGTAAISNIHDDDFLLN